MIKKITAGELAHKASQDNTKYLAREVGEAICHDVDKQLRDCIEKHRAIIDEDEFCIVRVIATDNLIKGAKRIKYYAWPYLPSPRPNQAVFLYNKSLDRITKRLWVLPDPRLMAFLASTMEIVPKEYQTMQAWSVAFFKGTFWDYVRHDQQTKMLSEHEYFLEHREELIKAGCQFPNADYSEPFDFSKIHIENAVDTVKPVVKQDGLYVGGET
jgi:hypothetical protein